MLDDTENRETRAARYLMLAKEAGDFAIKSTKQHMREAYLKLADEWQNSPRKRRGPGSNTLDIPVALWVILRKREVVSHCQSW